MIFHIRRALPADADTLSRIAISAKRHWGYPQRWIEVWTPQLTFPPAYFDENESWAAVVDGAPVAFYTLQERQGSGWLENLWVLPNYMGRGIGKSLFCHAVDLARGRGYTRLQLEADPHAVGFYEKMGMHRVAERQSEIEGQPRILPIMEITL